jgi:hypothetical protein
MITTLATNINSLKEKNNFFENFCLEPKWWSSIEKVAIIPMKI